MTGREKVQTLAAVAAVALAAGAHALMSPPPSPLYVNAFVLAAVAVCAYVATGNAFHNREVTRQEAAEKQAATDRAAAIRAAADLVITGRPDGPQGRPDPIGHPSVTPAAVAKYAATMGVSAVTLEEADAALRQQLQHRGFTSGAPFEANGSQ